MQWLPARESLWKRIPPAMRTLLKSYLLILAAALVVVALLFVLNIFLDFGGSQFTSRAFGTFFVLLFGWGWGILGAAMMHYAPLRAAGMCGLAVGVAFIVFGSLAVWDFGASYDLWNIPLALLVLQVALAAGVVGWMKLDDPQYAPVAVATIAVTALAGLVLAYLTLDIPGMQPDFEVRDNLGESAAFLGFWTAVASTLLLVPKEPEWRVARWLAYAAPAQLGVMLAIAPWLADSGGYQYGASSFAQRWSIAAWVVAAVLLLMGATAYIIAKMRSTEPGRA